MEAKTQVFQKLAALQIKAHIEKDYYQEPKGFFEALKIQSKQNKIVLDHFIPNRFIIVFFILLKATFSVCFKVIFKEVEKVGIENFAPKIAVIVKARTCM